MMHLTSLQDNLKRDNKVRVFTIDAIYGKELSV